MPELTLYTTVGCHLCAQAEEMLNWAAGRAILTWQAVDIADDPALFERYGVRIPVLRRDDYAAELGWPFDMDALLLFVDAPALS